MNNKGASHVMFYMGIVLLTVLFGLILHACGGSSDNNNNNSVSNLTWVKYFGGIDIDIGRSVKQTSDGGFVLTGFTKSLGAGEMDVYLVRTDAEGNIIWEKTFGGSNNDAGESILLTTDGGFIIVGSTDSFGAGNTDLYVIKTDANGNALWTKTFGGAGVDWAQSIEQTSDNGYIICGTTDSFGAGYYDIYLIKITFDGTAIWEKTFGGIQGEFGRSVRKTADGGYIIAGSSSSSGSGNYDAYLIKTDANGATIWEKTFGGSNADSAEVALQSSDGSFIVAGRTQSFGEGGDDVYVIKTDINGNPIFEKPIGGPNSDASSSIIETSDLEYMIIGLTESYGAGSSDVYLIKIDKDGNILWQKTYGGSERDSGQSVEQTSDGGYIIVGETKSNDINGDVYLVKIDSNGNY